MMTASPARATHLTITSAAALRATLTALLPHYKAAQVSINFGTAGTVHARAMGNPPPDLVIDPPKPLADLIKRGFVVPGSEVGLGVAKLALAVKQGAPVPKLATTEEVRAAFLAAPSLGFADPKTGATTGIYFAKLLEDQGLMKILGDRVHFFPDGQDAMEAVARGQIALAAGQLSEIKPVAGVQVAALMPQAWQLETVYTGSLSTKSENFAAARALLSWLAGPQTTKVFVDHGLARP